MLFHWAIAINSLFRLFGDGRFMAPLNLREGTIPAAAPTKNGDGYRPRFCYDRLGRCAERDLVRLMLASAAYYTEDAFSAILGENPTQWGFPDAQTPLSLDHCGRLITCWIGGLRDRVAPFAYERDPDPSAG